MDISVARQFYVFLFSLMSGALCGLIYDFFRALRRIKTPRYRGALAQDLLYWLTAAAVILYFGMRYAGGELRYYQMVGAAAGALVYAVTARSYILALFLTVYNVTTRIARFILRLVLAPVILLCRLLAPTARRASVSAARLSRKTLMKLKKINEMLCEKQKNLKKRLKML